MLCLHKTTGFFHFLLLVTNYFHNWPVSLTQNTVMFKGIILVLKTILCSWTFAYMYVCAQHCVLGGQIWASYSLKLYSRQLWAVPWMLGTDFLSFLSTQCSQLLSHLSEAQILRNLIQNLSLTNTVTFTKLFNAPRLQFIAKMAVKR